MTDSFGGKTPKVQGLRHRLFNSAPCSDVSVSGHLAHRLLRKTQTRMEGRIQNHEKPTHPRILHSLLPVQGKALARGADYPWIC